MGEEERTAVSPFCRFIPVRPHRKRVLSYAGLSHGSGPLDDVLAQAAESGRGFLLVTALADRWGVEPYPPGGKTVWAECAYEGSGPDTHSGRT